MAKILTALKFLIGIIIFLFIVFLLYSQNALNEIISSNFLLVPTIFGAILLAFAFKIARWHILLKFIKANPNKKNSVISYFSGYFLSFFTPGRAGEPIRAWCYKKLSNQPMRQTIPLVLFERIIDLMLLILISIIGIIFLTKNLSLNLFLIPILIILFFVLLAIFLVPKIGFTVLKIFGKLPFFNKRKEKIKEIVENFYSVRKSLPKPILIQLIVLSVLAWAVEAIALWQILLSVNSIVIPSIPETLSFISLSTVAGLISTIPGSLGVQDIGLLYLLTLKGILESKAAATVVLYRVYSLFFVLLSGIIYFFFLKLEK